MKNSGGENYERTLGIFVAISLLVLGSGLLATHQRLAALSGAQSPITATDAQSTTSAEPVGGPHGAVAEAGADYQPGPRSHVIEHVTPLTWFNGCGPTSAGMILTYWNWLLRSQGFNRVMPAVSTEQTQAVNDVIASPGHILDYAIPHDTPPEALKLDKSEAGQSPHISDSLADFMSTSFSARDNYFGWSWFSDVPKAFAGYLARVNPGQFTVVSYNVRMNDYSLSWNVYTDFIGKNMPVMLLVDSNGDGQTDHFVPGIGYDDTDPNVKYYAAYNTWDGLVHWYRWQPMANKSPYGVYGATILFIEHIPPFTATPTLTPIPTFTPLQSLTPSLTYTPFHTSTQTVTQTWTAVQTPTLHPVTTPVPTPAPVPSKPDQHWLLVFLLAYGLISAGAVPFTFIRLAVEGKRRND